MSILMFKTEAKKTRPVRFKDGPRGSVVGQRQMSGAHSDLHPPRPGPVMIRVMRVA